MKTPMTGTITELISEVPTQVLSQMVSQNRPEDYVFNIDVQNGFLLIW